MMESSYNQSIFLHTHLTCEFAYKLSNHFLHTYSTLPNHCHLSTIGFNHDKMAKTGHNLVKLGVHSNKGCDYMIRVILRQSNHTYSFTPMIRCIQHCSIQTGAYLQYKAGLYSFSVFFFFSSTPLLLGLESKIDFKFSISLF